MAEKWASQKNQTEWQKVARKELALRVPAHFLFMQFQTQHKLDFEVAPWPNYVGLEVSFHKFRIGTCEGLWRQNGDSYEILAIENSKPNNGHFKDVLQWFKNSCERDNFDLKVLELWNKGFEKHLIEKHGFKKFKGGVIWKRNCQKKSKQ